MSEVKVNKISPRTACGTVQLGDSGDTITIPAGATITNNGTQTGFGRTGTVDWQTGSIKTGTFSATNGEGYFVNTAGSTATANLPAGSAGAIVSFADYNNNFATNKFTITPNGSDKIGGENTAVDLTTAGQSVTLVFVDATEGWNTVSDSSENLFTSPFIVASGGTETTSGNFKIHTFTGPGTFTVCQVSATAANNTVGYAVIAGGGSGGSCCAAGGAGGGGYREGRNVPVDNFTASPLVADAPTNAVTVTATTFPITVGAGGASVGGTPSRTQGNRGSNSIFSTITSTGGGGGFGDTPIAPGPGGSGGGASHGVCSSGVGAGNTPPTTPSQGNDGGAFTTPSPSTTDDGGGGGGGAGGVGVGGPSASPIIGQGGPGVSSEITGSAVIRAGGGSAAMRNSGQDQPNVPVPAAPGGGGAGGGGANYPRPAAQAKGGNGTDNTGGGGGGAARRSPNPGGLGLGESGSGGSGVVIIRYRYQ